VRKTPASKTADYERAERPLRELWEELVVRPAQADDGVSDQHAALEV
jgi:hypothetical protein